MKNSKEMIYPKLESKLAGIRRVFQSNPFLKRTLPFIIRALALVWFLIRVIPKPQRASYPCMKVTYPLMSGLVIWILGITGISASVKLFFNNLRNKKYLFALGAVVMFAGLSIFFSLYHSDPLFGNVESKEPFHISN